MPANSKSGTRASSMAAKQIIDTIPSYISLYTQRSSPSPSPPPNNPDRTAILRWFSSLSLHHRLSHLTILDPSFSQLLLLMLSHLRSHGRGTFIVLPDIPSSSSPHLPTLCFRRSRGLLDRVAQFDHSECLIRDSLRLFSSKEAETVSCSSTCLDTVSFAEEFVTDVARFVDAMDRVSGSSFLSSDWGELGSDWVEFQWLKAKGYYSMEAFVANRLEAALRLAWLNSTAGKKRGVKLKLKEKGSSAGVAANVYWRKKGCVDWWEKLDIEVKKKALLMVLRKNTKSLIGEILKVSGRDSGGEICFISKGPRKPLRQKSYIAEVLRQDMDLELPKTLGSSSGNLSSPADNFSGLLVLHEISHMILAFQKYDIDVDKLFFSSLDSVNSLPDCILRKLRGLLMVVSLESMKFELFEEDDSKFPAKKPKEKQGSKSQKKKGKNRGVKKSRPALKESGHDGPIVESVQVSKICEAHQQKDIIVKTDEIVDTTMDIVKEEEKNVLIEEKKRTVTRKSRKDRTKSRSSGPNIEVPKQQQQQPSTFPSNNNSLNKVGITSSCITTQSEGKTFSHHPEHLLVQDLSVSSNNTYGPEKEIQRCMLASNSESPSSVDALPTHGPGEHAASAASNLSLECHLNPTAVKNEESINVKLDDASIEMDSYASTGYTRRRTETRQHAVSDIPRSFECRNENESENDSNDECNKNGPYAAAGSVMSSSYPSYEWPSVAPFRISSFNSHYHPHATDRLHLEVGHNWRSQFQQSSLQQIHQTGNSSVEAGGNIMSQPLQLGLDWPPTMRGVNRLASSLSCNYDSRYLSRRQPALPQSFGAHNPCFGTLFSDDERKFSSDFVELSDLTNTQELADEFDNNWLSEEEYTVSCIDYNQHFGGGVMYWNPSDYPGTGFSRPPSLSSDDSSWAGREADMTRTVDDMVAFPSSYSTNGLHSPSTAPFCSPFESLGPAQQAVSYARPGMEVNNKIIHASSAMTEADTKEDLAGDGDTKSNESMPYPILRPIIIPNISRERSRADFKRNHDLRSPCVPPNRRERPRIKRPPSPVVLCVPHASRPPTPSPVSDSRKHRGFPMVRSGSSSPRNWGVRGWFPDAMTFDETCGHIDVAEVVWPTWGSKKLSAHQLVQPLTGTLLQEHLIAISQLTHDQEHPDVTVPLQPPDLLNCPTRKASLPVIHNHLHEEIDYFCKKVAAENLTRRPYINWAVKRVARSLQVLWPRSRTNVFGSNVTGLSLPTSDVDLVVCLPPVRNLEPIKEAGILEGRNGIKETCLQHAARYLANQEWVKSDSLKTVENTAIPIIMLVVDVPYDVVTANASSSQRLPNKMTQDIAEQDMSQTETKSPDGQTSICLDLSSHGKDATSVRLDISFKSLSHTGLQTTQLVKELTEQFPAVIPLALVLKKFLADRSLDHAYSGGLSSYCLVLLITRFLQHEHHLGRAINQNLGGLLMDFLYFFGNVFDPRQMRISIQGSGLYIDREKGYSIDPIYIDDPLYPTNNVGKNCFRIHQCIKAFADAYSTLEDELNCAANDTEVASRSQFQLLQKIIPSISLL